MFFHCCGELRPRGAAEASWPRGRQTYRGASWTPSVGLGGVVVSGCVEQTPKLSVGFRAPAARPPFRKIPLRGEDRAKTVADAASELLALEEASGDRARAAMAHWRLALSTPKDRACRPPPFACRARPGPPDLGATRPRADVAAEAYLGVGERPGNDPPEHLGLGERPPRPTPIRPRFDRRSTAERPVVEPTLTSYRDPISSRIQPRWTVY